jgi:hypothetical protein
MRPEQRVSVMAFLLGLSAVAWNFQGFLPLPASKMPRRKGHSIRSFKLCMNQAARGGGRRRFLGWVLLWQILRIGGSRLFFWRCLA